MISTLSANTRKVFMTAFVAASNAFVLPSSPTFMNQRMGSMRMAMSSSSFVDSINGKYLLSVQECINSQKEEEEEEGSRVVFVDGSWHLTPDRDGREEFEKGPRIKDARFFDIDDISSKGTLNPKGLPHMCPPKALYEAAMKALEIDKSDHVIIYGTENASMFIHRAAYTFKAMGHGRDKVHLMQGSLTEFKDSGGIIETGPTSAIKASELNFLTEDNDEKSSSFVDMDDVMNAVLSHDKGDSGNKEETPIIIDARPAGRFQGTAPEPRAGMRSGHMPGSLSVPASDMLDGYTLKPKEELLSTFKEAGISADDERPIYISCGSGVTACVVASALESLGRDPSTTFVYDGSWAEWGSDPDTPVTT